jgi:cysteine synthase A
MSTLAADFSSSKKTFFVTLLGVAVSVLAYNVDIDNLRKKFGSNTDQNDIERCSDASSYDAVIGNTPLVLLKSASALSGCKVYVKMECLNPGGTGKDRAAKAMLDAAYQSDARCRIPGCHIVEGTSGSTGIALANLCQTRNLQLHVVMPDDQALEKRQLLERLGVQVHIVPNCAISNANHYVNAARRLAKDLDGIFINQFENLANYKIHERTTGPEIWKQTCGDINAFVMSAGTGGTIAGVSKHLKDCNFNIEVILADPQGSSLFNRVTHGVCFTKEQAEKKLKKHRYDTIVEGVGLDRVTANFEQAMIDRAECISDQEALDTAHWVLRNEGLLIGSSTALNIAATMRVAHRSKQGNTIVTIICDAGTRHLSRFWNPDYIQKCSLFWPEKDVKPQWSLAFETQS